MTESGNAETTRILRLPQRVGLRTRILFSFTTGSLAISAFMSLATLGFTRHSLLQERESRASDRAVRNAAFIATQLSTRERTDDPTNLVDSVQTPATPVLWLRSPTAPNDAQAARAYVGGGGISIDDIPESMKNRVMWSYTPALMRTRIDGVTQLVVGVPLSNNPSGAYFEVEPLTDVEETVRTLGIVMLGTATLTTLAGAALGYYASRRALRPLTLIGDAARRIADGRLETRLDAADYSEDPELGPLVSSFNEMVSALQRRIDQDARFASDVSHELRSPLTTLTASVSVLRNAADDLPKRPLKALELLETDIARFSQLVEDLLEISRFDAGAVRLEPDDVAIADFVRTYVNRSAPGVRVEVDPVLEDQVVVCDGRRILRILANFLENAGKYGEGAELVTVAADGDDLVIGVEDAGPGVPMEERDRIFSRFSRGAQGGARGSDTGSGLGLALASEHARLQGGTVGVEDRPDGGIGARFTVSLPVLHTMSTAGEDDPTAEQPVISVGGDHNREGSSAS